jgi:solute carrier family 66, member 2
MRWLKAFTGYLAPIFLILSPILSYSDQAIAMYRQKSSAGFSLDIPLIMLVASMLK